MFFVIDYDRRAGEIRLLLPFEDRGQAETARLALEVEAAKPLTSGLGAAVSGLGGIAAFRELFDREIVMLEAESVDALRVTHRRYFANLTELAEHSAA
ncbi:MAG TPA: hypothetical protein VKG44_09640 [Candidatus Baltobacteraceae bacterium]|nr:hypothetical protein [Candidatus Baltobacteraceae bacterium]